MSGQVQQGIPKKFDQIRGNIDDLNRALTRDPKLGLQMDAVVAQMLAQQKGQDKKKIQQWLANQQGQPLSEVLGTASSVGFVASLFNPSLVPLATTLSVGSGLASLTEIPRLMDMKSAIEAGSGGTPLTTQTSQDAGYNLTMAWTNAALAGLDLGLETRVVQRALSSAGRLAVQGVRLSRPQWVKILQSARRSPAELDLYLATQKNSLQMENNSCESRCCPMCESKRRRSYRNRLL